MNTILIGRAGGEADEPGRSARYVLLKHDWPAVHYDLVVERGESLATWAFSDLPGPGAATAIELPPHRIEYLDYEGAVTGGRGTVRRIDRGRCDIAETPAGSLTIRLRGELFRGTLRLSRTGVSTPRGVVWASEFQSAR